MKNNSIILTVVVAILVGAVAFYGGMQYQKGQRGDFGGRNGQRQFGGNNRQGGRPVTGEIISADGDTITVKLQDGSSKIVIISDSTAINKAANGTKADLKAGETVAAFGTENSDGSVTAQSVQLNPVLFRRGGRNRQDR